MTATAVMALGEHLGRTKTLLRVLFLYHRNRTHEAIELLGIRKPASRLSAEDIEEIVLMAVKPAIGPTRREGCYDIIDVYRNHPDSVEVSCSGCGLPWVRNRGQTYTCAGCDEVNTVPPRTAG